MQIFKYFVSARIQSDLTSEISFKFKFWFAPADDFRFKEYGMKLQILEDFVSVQIQSNPTSQIIFKFKFWSAPKDAYHRNMESN